MENEKQTDDGLDAIIDRYDMTTKCQLSREEIRFRVRKAMVLLNLSHCLADVADYMVTDAECILTPFGATFKREDKMYFKRLIESLHAARRYAQQLTVPAYHSADGDDFATDTEWWYNFVRMTQDRIGEDVTKTRLLLEYISTMPSELGMFKLYARDFKRAK